MIDPNERFVSRIPIAAKLGALAGVVAVNVSGVRCIGVLGSRFNTGFNAERLGEKVGAVTGVAILTTAAWLKERTG